MSASTGFTSQPLSLLRKAVIASASVTRQKNAIHALTETDVSVPRQQIRDHASRTGIRISFTAYLARCLAVTIQRHPGLNAFIAGGRLIFPDQITISVLVERELNGERYPEPLVIHDCGALPVDSIHTRIRNAQQTPPSRLGALSGNRWFRLIPGFLMKAMIRLADRSVKMGLRYGKLAITSVGMHCQSPVWFIPHGSATVLLTVGSMINRVVETDSGYETREHLCLTVSFDHDVVDGAPAARFMQDLTDEIRSGRELDFLKN